MTPPSQPPQPSPSQPPQPKFDPSAAHMGRPRLRPVRGFPLQAQGPDGKQVTLLGLADARQVSDKVVATMPAAQLVLPLMDGTRDLDQITAEVGRGLTRPILEGLVAQLDDAGLLEGPTFEAILKRVRAEFDSLPVLPPASTAAFADAVVAQKLGAEATEEQKAAGGAAALREVFDSFIARAMERNTRPAFDALPKAVVAPHLDYPRGWSNYAGVYGRMKGVERPARVVVLGTNHYGQSTGVCGCDKGFSTALGTCEIDGPMHSFMRSRLGDALFENRYDHEREHSVELQIPWIQHTFGPDSGGKHVPVFGVLVHDPAVNNGEAYDGNGIGLGAFVEALKEAMATLPGRTLVVGSVDLSHVGPAFGDQQALLGEDAKVAEFRNGIVKHDQEMLALVQQNKPSELIAAMAWQQNPTRWCSTGALAAALMATEPSEIELIDYSAAIDSQGMAMVSSAAMVMR